MRTRPVSPLRRLLQARRDAGSGPPTDDEPARDANAKIDESLEETFPASDAPSWVSLARIGAPDRSRER